MKTYICDNEYQPFTFWTHVHIVNGIIITEVYRVSLRQTPEEFVRVSTSGYFRPSLPFEIDEWVERNKVKLIEVK